MLETPRARRPTTLRAVQAPRHTGLLALRALAHGSVLIDPDAATTTFFIAARAASRWSPLPGVSVLDDGAPTELPQRTRTRPPGPFWLTEVRARIIPSPAVILHRALAQVAPGALPARQTLSDTQARGAACVWCGAPLGVCATDLGVQRDESAGSLVLWFPRACTICRKATGEQS